MCNVTFLSFFSVTKLPIIFGNRNFHQALSLQFFSWIEVVSHWFKFCFTLACTFSYTECWSAFLWFQLFLDDGKTFSSLHWIFFFSKDNKRTPDLPSFVLDMGYVCRKLDWKGAKISIWGRSHCVNNEAEFVGLNQLERWWKLKYW